MNYNEMAHDHYDWSLTKPEDRTMDLGDNLPVKKLTAKEREIEKVFGKFDLISTGEMKVNKLSDEEVMLLLEEQDSDFMRDVAVRRNLIPSAEELI